MHSTSGQPFVVGLSSTLIAVTLPETWVSYGGKFVFAIVTALATSTVSALWGNYLKRNQK